MRYGMAVIVVAGLAALAIGGCQPRVAPADSSDVMEARPQPVSLRVELPEWWRDEPEANRGRVSVCAMADEEDLLAARRGALDAAARVFQDVTGRRPVEVGIETDSARLVDGRFRAYVRLTGVPE